MSEEDPPLVLPIDGELDLHTFAPADVLSVVADYLDECRRRGILRVRVVHGRGKGVQRAAIRRLLAAREDVSAVTDAGPEEGGWGATLVLLRPAHD
jgi:DNA-nicking Smr family endonuclease